MIYWLLIIFWLIYHFKNTLFWIYLWQLKEYHIGRFIDHFRTDKGKKILLRKLQFFKFFIILSFIFPRWIQFLFYLTLFLYFFETLKTFYDILNKKLLKPTFTQKSVFLFFFSVVFSLFYLIVFFESSFLDAFYLLIFDFLSPAIISGIILIFQPVSALYRTRIIKKAIQKREKFKNLLVIGITGSYGKTSTKEFLATILEKKFPGKVLKTKEHQNSEVGISRCILEDLKETHQIFIVEMGAYNKGGIKLLAKIVKPKIGILTGVNEQHLALFGSMGNLISAEGGKELIESLPKDGLVIFNGENEILNELYKKTEIKKKIVGINKKNFDLWAANIKVKKEILFFQVFTKEGEMADFSLNLIGSQNIQNILLAACCAKELGMSLKEISDAILYLTQEQTGIKLIKLTNNFQILDSTYSTNPSAVLAHIDHLKNWSGKKIIVMPCLIELGKKAREIHKQIGMKIGAVCDLAIIVTKDYFKEIKEAAIKSGMPEDKILFLENPKEIVKKIENFYQKEDIILLEGRIPRQIKQLLYQNKV